MNLTTSVSPAQFVLCQLSSKDKEKTDKKKREREDDYVEGTGDLQRQQGFEELSFKSQENQKRAQCSTAQNTRKPHSKTCDEKNQYIDTELHTRTFKVITVFHMIWKLNGDM